jgi:hypothetical protein
MSTDATELTGIVVNGIVVLDQPGKLADGTEVRVRPVVRTSKPGDRDASLSKMLLSFAGTIEGLPEDMAVKTTTLTCMEFRRRRNESSLRRHLL